MIHEVYDKKELMRLLVENIENDTNLEYSFEGFSFYRTGSSGYAVFDSDGNNTGFFDVSEIKNFFKRRILKRKENIKKIKSSGIKKKSRKKKDGDMIIPEFMSFLHTKSCVVNGCNESNIEVHHVLGRQPYRYDNLCVPLCPAHHRGSEYSWHEGNIRKFRKDYSKEKLSDMAIKFFQEWIDSGEAARLNYDESFFRFVNDKIFDREEPISSSIRSAILEYRAEYE